VHAIRVMLITCPLGQTAGWHPLSPHVAR
jgi:hypothetical protein